MPVSRLAFLAGAGISVPSGLPTAWAFNKSLARFLGRDLKESKVLQELLTVGYVANDGVRVRFEQVVQILRDFDPTLSILRMFDETGNPTYFHHFLAWASFHGASVFTTNFDSLIERACHKHAKHPKPLLHQVIYENENRHKTHNRCTSFERYLNAGCPKPAILKLHGSLRLLYRTGCIGLPSWELDGLGSIGATLDKVGRPSADLRLEPNKEAVLAKLLKKHILCVIGYSGADDFDITPSLALAIRNCGGIIWIRHDPNCSQAVTGRSRTISAFLPSGIRSICATKDSVVFSGDSAQIVQELFGVAITSDESPIFNTRPVDTVLSGYEPYTNMPRLTKDLIYARIATEATDLVKAKQIYQRIIRKANNRENKPQKAIAFFQLGVIARIQCKLATALYYLKSADRHADKDTRLKRQILNVIGNVHLDMGDLNMALRYYKRAQQSLKKDGDETFQSAILTNMGLVERKLSHYGRALHYTKRALALSTASRNRTAMARDYGNIGTIFLRLKNYPSALGSYTRAINLARKLGTKETLATTLMNRALVLKHLKRFREAERLALEALRLETAMRRTQGIARYYSLVAGLAYEKKDFLKSVRMLQKAIKIQKPLKRLEGLADDWYSLGDGLKQLNRLSDAKNAYIQSKNCYNSLGNTKGVMMANNAIKALHVI